MKIIKRPGKIDFSIFSKNAVSPDVKYGLPREIIYCNICVQSNQRPTSTVEFQNSIIQKKKTLNLNQKNVCDACLFAEKKKKINWEEREKELVELCNKYRKKDGEYDCIVPGSGGKDSIYASHILKEKYQMNPLTITWSPSLYTDWGYKNFKNWINTGSDNILFTPSGKTHRLLTRLALENLLHPFQPFILGQKTLAAKIAKMYKIPLIFYGESEVEYGNPIDEASTAKVNEKLFSTEEEYLNLVLGGTKIKDLIDNFGLSKNELNSYIPENRSVFQDFKLDFHYLGYYLKWHPQSCYYYSVEKAKFEASPERTSGTYSKYNSIDDKVDDLHYYTTFVKFGIGRATYDAAQEIRSGDITREEGVALVKKFDGEYPKRFLPELLEYLSINKKEFPVANKMFEEPNISESYFNELCDSFRSPHIWYYRDNKWYLRKNITQN